MKYHPLTFALRLPVLFALLLVYSLQPTAYSLTPTVRINEVMASNGTTLADDDGDFEDWIELYNYGTEPVDLSGWGLSDSYNNPFKWTFPVGTTIGAGDYLLVWASGKDRDPSSFGSGRWLFNEGGGSVVTDYSPVNNDGVIVGDGQLQSDEFFDGAIDLGVEGRVDLELFVSLEEDFTVAYWFKTRRANDWRALNVRNGFGPGHQRSNRIVLMSPYLVINLSESFVVSQWEHITLRRADGVLTVFRNAAPVAEVSWNGTVVFDRIGGTSGSSAWPAFDGKLAEVFALSSALSNEEVGLLFDGNLGDRGQWHTNYSLSASGEEVILTMPDGTRVDELSPTALPRDVSIGRVNGEGDAWFFFDQPTPGGINDTTAYLGILDPPNFSHAGGFYEEGFDLVLSHPDPEVTIVYTLDGSVPDINNIGGTIYFYKNSYPRVLGDPFGEFIESSFVSEIYNDPIEISDRSLKPNTISMISSTAEKNPNYFPTNPVRKGTVIRAAVFREGFLQSQLLTNSYFVFEDSKMYSLPIISLAVSPVDLFDYDEGIYVAGIDYDQWWIDHPGTQPPHHFHLLESFNFWRSGRLSERNANIEFLDRNINALSLLNSEAGIRVHGNASRLHSKKNLRFYARDTMGGSLFQHRFFDSEIPFSYRSDFFPRRLLLRGRGNGGPFINDWFTSKILQPVYEGISRVKAVVHFINGEYWGISAIRDRFDQYHLANAFNLDPDEIIITWRNAIDVGDDLDLFIVNQSLTYLENLDMENPNAFSAIQDHLCVRSYIDHLVANIYFSNTHHEYGFWRTRNPSGVGFDDGRLRVYTQDFDQILRTEDRLSVRRRSALLGNLLENASFLRYFVNRFCDHINTTFAVARMELVAEEGYAELLPYIGEDFDRWNSVFMTRGQVDSYIQYAREQPERQREFLRQNLGVGEDAKISIVRTQEGQGDVRVNTVIINENTPGVSATPYPWTGTYFQGVPIELEALPEPGHRFVGWVVSPAGGMASLSEGEPDFYSTEPLISLDLSGDTTVEAVFEPIPLADLPV
ncbi:MAG: lamin tail domain-containing protein, partial [Opitutales bacterium]|nr:lamin tail domain-containing protein [Opitutales bacterium]